MSVIPKGMFTIFVGVEAAALGFIGNRIHHGFPPPEVKKTGDSQNHDACPCEIDS
ncbi:MAG: hypothetical protein GTO40_20620 [Deltaproteobacteria bacterium]|nr:hypothetical protein [Deltaproteobacteria bacterium]